MLDVARKRADQLSLNVSFLLADAEALPFRDEIFDTVASSLSTCTFPNPIAVLENMARVCRTEGRVLLLEHGRSDCERLGRWQDRTLENLRCRLVAIGTGSRWISCVKQALK